MYWTKLRFYFVLENKIDWHTLFQRLKGYQDEVNNFYFRKDHEVEKEKTAYENLKKELENKIRFVSRELCNEISVSRTHLIPWIFFCSTVNFSFDQIVFYPEI